MISQARARAYFESLMSRGYSEEEAMAMTSAYVSRHGGTEQTEMSLEDSIAKPVVGAVTDRAIQSILGGGSAAGAAEIGSGLAATAEANAAWNAAAMGAEVLPEVMGPWSLEGIGAAGNYILPAAGALGALDLFSNKRHGGRGAAQGALSGAAMGSYFGPVGIGVGAVLGGGLGYFGNFGDEDKYLTEYNRAQALRDKGINWDLNTQKPSAGRSKEELTSEAARNIAMGQYGNVEYAQSRNMEDSRPEDWWGYSIWGEKFGDDWLKKYSEDQRRQIVQRGLELNLFDENTGSLDVNFTPEYEADIQKILSGEMKVETTPWEPGIQEGPARGAGPYPISINISGGGGSGNANADLTSQALIEMGLSNDDSVNLINSYKQLGALTPNEAAAAAYSVGKMKGPI